MAAGPTLVGLFVTFLVILAVLQVVFPRREGFADVVTPSTPKVEVPRPRQRGAMCGSSDECDSMRCNNGKCA